MLASCAAAACPSALCPAQDWQGLVAANLASFSFPKSADFRAYLLRMSAAFQCSPSRLEAAPVQGAEGCRGSPGARGPAALLPGLSNPVFPWGHPPLGL